MAELFDSVGHTRFTHVCAVFICILQPIGKQLIARKFVRRIVLDECVKFRKSSLKPFSRNSTKSRRRRHFRQFFRDNFRPEVDSDVISGTAESGIATVASGW